MFFASAERRGAGVGTSVGEVPGGGGRVRAQAQTSRRHSGGPEYTAASEDEGGTGEGEDGNEGDAGSSEKTCMEPSAHPTRSNAT